MDATQAAQNALECVLETKKNDSLNIFCDNECETVGRAFEKGALNLGLRTKLVMLKADQNIRTKVPPEITQIITNQHADIYINLFRDVSEETSFRIQTIKLETRDHKTRLGHCPGVTLDMLTKGGLALTASEHRQMQNFAKNLIKQLTDVSKVEISTPAGTDLVFSVEGRPFFTDTMLDWVTMNWMNLPTGEVMVAPVENSLNGVLVCDMAIGGVGPVEKPVTIQARNGKAQSVAAQDKKVLKTIQASLDKDTGSNVVGEFAFGLNPKARFVSEFLEAEKICGTVHLAFGNNSDFPGGLNSSLSHMDFLMNKPTVKATLKNGEVLTLVNDGVFQTNPRP